MRRGSSGGSGQMSVAVGGHGFYGAEQRRRQLHD